MSMSHVCLQYNYKGALNAEELVGFVNTKGRFSRNVGGSLHAGVITVFFRAEAG